MALFFKHFDGIIHLRVEQSLVFNSDSKSCDKARFLFALKPFPKVEKQSKAVVTSRKQKRMK